MRTALIALIVCGVMVSAFAMTNVAAAAKGGQGKSPIEQYRWTQSDGTYKLTKNEDTGHEVYHVKALGEKPDNEQGYWIV